MRNILSLLLLITFADFLSLLSHFRQVLFQSLTGFLAGNDPPKEDAVFSAYRQALADQVHPYVSWHLLDPQLRLFVNFCISLQELHGGGTFFLSYATVQKVFNLTYAMDAKRWISHLVNLKILRLIERAPRNAGVASVYSYVLKDE